MDVAIPYKDRSGRKVLFVGVFDSLGRSTSNGQLAALNVIGWDVTPYDFRQKAREIGAKERDLLLEKTVKDGDFDLVLFSKCDTVSYRTFEYVNSLTTTCFWFCDPLSSYDQEMQRKTTRVLLYQFGIQTKRRWELMQHFNLLIKVLVL